MNLQRDTEDAAPASREPPAAVDRAARALLYATLLAPALAVFPRADAGFGPQAALKFGLLTPLAVGWAWLARREARWTLGERALAGLALAAGLGAWVTRQPLAGAAPSLLGASCLCLIARGVRARLGDDARALDGALLLSALAVAAFAFAELLGLVLPWALTQRPQGTLANRNYVAGYLAIALPLLCAAASRRPRWLPSLAVVAAVIVATRCRSAYLASLAAGAVALSAYALRARWRPAGGALAAPARTPPPARGASSTWVTQGRAVALVSVLAAGAAAGALAPWPGVRFNQSASQAAARLLEHDRGSGRARVEQHRLGLEALKAAPSRWIMGAGPGSWEDVTSAQAHAVAGRHVAMVVGPNSPNSDALRVLVEQGLVGVACCAAALALALRGLWRRAAEGEPLAPLAALAAALTAAFVHGLFDAPLARAECVALLGVMLGMALGGGGAASRLPAALAFEGAASRLPAALAFEGAASRFAAVSAPEGAGRRRDRRAPVWLARRLAALAPLLAGAALALVSSLRAGSFWLSASVPPASPLWEPRQEAALRLLPHAGVFEELALVRAHQGRCDEAAASLERLNALRPHHWGARVEVASCFTRQGRRQEAGRLWSDARRVDEHLGELVAALRARRSARAP